MQELVGNFAKKIYMSDLGIDGGMNE
jgi:hypothetical protein